MLKLLGSCAAAAFALAGAANAAVIDSADLLACDNDAACSDAVEGWSMSASAGVLDIKSLNGVNGLGVTTQGNATSGEIDIGETIAIAFDAVSTINGFSIAFFYNGPEFGDLNEIGKILVTLASGGVEDFYLRADGEGQANLYADSAFAALIAAGANCGGANNQTASGPGCFAFGGDPLGALAVSAISFTALDDGNGGSNNSDYSLAGLAFTEVPVPGALLLMLSGLAGLGAAARRRA